MPAGLYYISFYCQVWGNMDLQLHSNRPSTAWSHSNKRKHRPVKIPSAVNRVQRLLLGTCSVKQFFQLWFSQKEATVGLLLCGWSRSCKAKAPCWRSQRWKVRSRWLQFSLWPPDSTVLPGMWAAVTATSSLNSVLPASHLGKQEQQEKPRGMGSSIDHLLCRDGRGTTENFCWQNSKNSTDLINWTPAKHSQEKGWSFLNSFSWWCLGSLFSRHLDHPCLPPRCPVTCVGTKKFCAALQWNRSGTNTSWDQPSPNNSWL